MNLTAEITDVVGSGVYRLETDNGRALWVALRYIDASYGLDATCELTDDRLEQRRCDGVRDLLLGEQVEAAVDLVPMNGPRGAVYPADLSMRQMDVATILVNAGEFRIDHTQAPPIALTRHEAHARCAFRGVWAPVATDPVEVERCRKYGSGDGL